MPLTTMRSPGGVLVPVRQVGARQAGSVSGGFDPRALGGCVLRLRADSLALAQGSPVAAWPDQSSSGVVLAQGVSAKRPTFQAVSSGNLPAILFSSATTTALSTPVSFPTGSIFHVIAQTAAQPADFGTFNCVSSAGQYYFTAASSPIPPTSWDTGDGPVGLYYRDGVQTASLDNTLGVAHIYELQDLSLRTAASGWLLGQDRSLPSRNFTGTISEVIAYSRILKASERLQVLQYLAKRYSITLP